MAGDVFVEKDDHGKYEVHLEDGDLPLEDSLELFEKGIKLSRECRERLANAERRIEILMKDSDGNLTAAEIDPESLRD